MTEITNQIPNNALATPQMSLLKAELLIDIGNSETRVYLHLLNKRYYFVLRNRFAEVPAGVGIDKKYVDKRSTLFQYGGKNYVNGYIVDMEYEHEVIRPSSYEKKVDQEVTYLTLQAVIARATCILFETGEVDLTKVKLAYSLNVLLPPLDAISGYEKLKENLDKLKVVTLQIPYQMTVPVELSLDVKAEAICAFFSAFFKQEGVEVLADNTTNPELNLHAGDYYSYDLTNVTFALRESNIKYHNGDLLVIDIGAGTSDAVIVRNMEIIESSRDTIKIGGNLVESSLRTLLKQSQLGLTLTKNDLVSAVATGIAYEGTKQHDVAEYVGKAKEKYAGSFLEELKVYFEGNQVEPRRFSGVLVAGGGGLPTTRSNGETEEEVVPAMVHYILEYLKQIAPSIEDIDTEGQDLRKMNLDGAAIINLQTA